MDLQFYIQQRRISLFFRIIFTRRKVSLTRIYFLFPSPAFLFDDVFSVYVNNER